jgi:hypothetical protein
MYASLVILWLVGMTVLYPYRSLLRSDSRLLQAALIATWPAGAVAVIFALLFMGRTQRAG